MADYFERAVAVGQSQDVTPKAIANWVTGDVFHLLHSTNEEISACKIAPEQIPELVLLVNQNVITAATARRVLEAMFHSGGMARDIVREKGLAQISDHVKLAHVIDEVIAANPDAVSDFRNGKDTVLRFLIGQVMRATMGKANPNLATEMLKNKLNQ